MENYVNMSQVKPNKFEFVDNFEETSVDFPQEQPNEYQYFDTFEEPVEYNQTLDPSIDKYVYAADKMKVRDMQAFLKQARSELQSRSKMWVEEFYKGIQEAEGLSPQDKKLKFEGDTKIVIDVNDCGNVFASVECPECHKEVRIGLKKMKRQSSTLCTYKRQNFDRHMTHLHLKTKGFVLVKKKL